MFERNTSLNVASREEKKATGVLDARSVVIDESRRVAANDDKMIRPRVDISQLSDEDIRASFPVVNPVIREAGARLREKVRLAKIERGRIQGEQLVDATSVLSQEKETSSLMRQTENEQRISPDEQSSESRQTLPLSSQALRFEIQTREEQLKTLQDQSERIRIQSQLQAYRKLLERNEPRTVRDEQLVSSQALFKTTTSRLWGRVKGWFGNVFGK